MLIHVKYIFKLLRSKLGIETQEEKHFNMFTKLRNRAEKHKRYTSRKFSKTLNYRRCFLRRYPNFHASYI